MCAQKMQNRRHPQWGVGIQHIIGLANVGKKVKIINSSISYINPTDSSSHVSIPGSSVEWNRDWPT